MHVVLSAAAGSSSQSTSDSRRLCQLVLSDGKPAHERGGCGKASAELRRGRRRDRAGRGVDHSRKNGASTPSRSAGWSAICEGSGGERAERPRGGAVVGNPRCSKMRLATRASSMSASKRIGPAQRGQWRTSIAYVRFSSVAHSRRRARVGSSGPTSERRRDRRARADAKVAGPDRRAHRQAKAADPARLSAMRGGSKGDSPRGCRTGCRGCRADRPCSSGARPRTTSSRRAPAW
jgi:hypothetical protein